MKLLLYKKHCTVFISVLLIAIASATGKEIVFAKDNTITKGISAGTLDFSGLTKEEAKNKVETYVEGFTSKKVVLDVDGNKVTLTAGGLGYYWKNTEIIDEAYEYGKHGNIIKRYKECKDIEQDNVKYDIEFDVDDEVMKQSIEAKCAKYNIPHVNAKITKIGDSFSVSTESTGRMIDMDTTISDLHDMLMNNWNGNDTQATVTVVDDLPIGTAEDCAKVKDLLGTYTTKFTTSRSNYNRNSNMENGVKHLNGVTLCQGETFSANALLEPWTSANGWREAGTYVNGKVENSLGGGICQVSTTLYNAVMNAELEVTERHCHSMSVGYVPLSMDAALAGTWKDLKFKNNLDVPIYIEGIYNPSGSLTFNIYGLETRPAGRTIEYISETMSSIPSKEVITQDSSLPNGYRKVTSSGHTGYTARLIKKVYMNGSVQSETVVNESTYASSPTQVTVGTGLFQDNSNNDQTVGEEGTNSDDVVPDPGSDTEQAPQNPTELQGAVDAIPDNNTVTSE